MKARRSVLYENQKRQFRTNSLHNSPVEKPSRNNIVDIQQSRSGQQQLKQQQPSQKNILQSEDLTLKNLMKQQISSILRKEQKKYLNQKLEGGSSKSIKFTDAEDQDQGGIMKLMKRQIFHIVEKAQKNQQINLPLEKVQQPGFNPNLKQNRSDQKIMRPSKEESFKNKSIQLKKIEKEKEIVSSKQKIGRKIKTESPMNNSSVVRKYELNVNKFEKIQNDREEVFRARPKLSNTPGLIQQKVESKPKIKKKVQKNKTEPNTNLKLNYPAQDRNQIVASSLFPSITNKSKIMYTQSPKCYDIIQNISHSLLLSKNKQTQFGYRPVSLIQSNQGLKQLQLTKVLRKKRFNFLKT